MVCDNAAGIKRENLRRIFDPFFTTKGEKGTGLGLWVSQGIVQKHGGKILVRSKTTPGQSGTTFLVFLPRRRVAVMKDAA
jgi:signal transduction histidine kinase